MLKASFLRRGRILSNNKSNITLIKIETKSVLYHCNIMLFNTCKFLYIYLTGKPRKSHREKKTIRKSQFLLIHRLSIPL